MRPGCFTDSAPFLTREDVDRMIAVMRAFDLQKAVVGIAVSPQMVEKIRQSTGRTEQDAGLLIGSVPFIVDPRLGTLAETYYDAGAWRERCREQRIYDAETFCRRMKNSDAHTPDHVAIMGKAWRRDFTELMQQGPHASVAGWIIWAPWAHPGWQAYSLDIIHLRPVAGLGDPKIHLPGATHEILLFAIDPDWKLNPKAVPRWLEPINFASQFMAESDEAARAAGESAMLEIIRGELSPDTDARRQWTQRFGANMIKREMFEGIVQAGDTVIVHGTGASNIRTLTGPQDRN